MTSYNPLISTLLNLKLYDQEESHCKDLQELLCRLQDRGPQAFMNRQKGRCRRSLYGRGCNWYSSNAVAQETKQLEQVNRNQKQTTSNTKREKYQ